jgi:hypothetical protein
MLSSSPRKRQHLIFLLTLLIQQSSKLGISSTNNISSLSISSPVYHSKVPQSEIIPSGGCEGESVPLVSDNLGHFLAYGWLSPCVFTQASLYIEIFPFLKNTVILD